MRHVSPVAHGSYFDCAGLSCSVQAPSLVKIGEKEKFLFLDQCIVVPSVCTLMNFQRSTTPWWLTHQWVTTHQTEQCDKWPIGGSSLTGMETSKSDAAVNVLSMILNEHFLDMLHIVQLLCFLLSWLKEMLWRSEGACTMHFCSSFRCSV